MSSNTATAAPSPTSARFIIQRKDTYWDDDADQWLQGREETGPKLQDIAPHLISQADLDALGRNTINGVRGRGVRPARQLPHHLCSRRAGCYQGQARKLNVLGQLTSFSNTTMGRGTV
ncbi:hypothetical protein [Arenimonas composti]|uniref:hypothetical protein n=1 Tax=Arenimonas composti TaxID=370776 RepID=UPI0012B67943|nr:hypothetical protein [Arenimonas composti]